MEPRWFRLATQLRRRSEDDTFERLKDSEKSTKGINVIIVGISTTNGDIIRIEWGYYGDIIGTGILQLFFFPKKCAMKIKVSQGKSNWFVFKEATAYKRELQY